MTFVDWTAAGCVANNGGQSAFTKNAAQKISSDIPTLVCIVPVIASVVQIALYFLGSVATLFLLWGAIQFVLSGGDQKAVQKARNTMTYAILGVVLIFLSFLAMNFINDFLGLPKGTLLNFGFNQAPPGP